MPVISLRLPDDLEARLAKEAEMTGKPRSELAREAIADHLARREQERFMTELATAARTLADNPEARRETLEIAETGVDDGLDTLAGTGRASGTESTIPWWR